MTPTRRGLLKLGLLGSALLGVGGVGLALQPTHARAPRVALRALDERTFSILAAVADAVCPGADGLLGAWELQVPERVDAHLDRLHPADVAELKQALLLLENGLAGLVLDGRPRAFSACDLETRSRVLARWKQSRIGVRRQAYRALVSLVSASYWTQPATFAFVGYPGPPRVGAP